MKVGSKKRINTEKPSKRKDSYNSFLVETSFNSDIDLKTRKEIDIKFSQSKMNSQYKFPRKVVQKPNKSRQITTKSSIDSILIPKPSHKTSKSSTILLPVEIKIPEKTSPKKVIFNLKISALKKPSEKSRNHSSRLLKSDRLTKSKSPKQIKKNESNPKNLQTATASKKESIDCSNKIFTPYTSKSKMVQITGSNRIKKVYHKSKTSLNIKP